ncbi:MAG TPA: serine/threonine-protein kinase [Kofleriaceae bacterium]|nr:serine/threonine-protein kinase [Kofleriaceae bacterium]
MSGEATRDDLVATTAGDDKRPGVTPGARYGDYVVLEPIGRGAMGQVFRALHPQLDRHVALKLIALPTHAGARRLASLRVLREGRALARLRHPNVVAVHDVGEAGDHAYVAMELVDGSTLRDWANRPRSGADLLATVVAAGRGLAAAHRAGLVHRDVKPDNILVSKTGEVRVTDFGLARLVDEPADDALPATAVLATDGTLSRSDAPIGTLAYMAPEILDGHQATRACDQFSFCVTAFECLYGRRPFDGASIDELRANIVAGRIAKVPPSRTARLLRRGLAARPGDRHPTLGSLLDQLEPATRRWLPWLVATTSIAAGLVAVSFAARPADATARQACELAARWDGVWDASRAEAVHRAFAGTKLPYADAGFAQIRTTLDRYAEMWSEQERDRCLVASGDESPDVRYELACLDQRRDDVDTLVTALTTADVDTVRSAARMSAALRAPAICRLAPGAHPIVAVPQIRRGGELASARVAYDRGDLAAAERIARQVIERSSGIDVIEARLLLGTVQVALHREGDDETTLFATAIDAEGAGLPALAAEAWLELAVATIDRPSGQAPRWIALAEIAVRNAGNPPDLASKLASERAEMAMRTGDYAIAVKLQRDASALLAATYGDGDLRVATSDFYLARHLGMVARCREAEPLLREVVAIRARALSPAHPDTLDADETLGVCLIKMKRPGEALPIFERTLHAREALVGTTSVSLAGSLNNLGTALADLQRTDDALATFRRSIALREAAYGPHDERVARPLVNLGTLLAEHGHVAEALERLRRARDIFESLGGSGLIDGGFARLQIADVLMRQHRNTEAVAELEPLDTLPPPQHAILAGDILLARGTLFVELGKPEQAIPLLEAAAKLPDNDRLTHAVRQQISEMLDRARRAARRAGSHRSSSRD